MTAAFSDFRGHRRLRHRRVAVDRWWYDASPSRNRRRRRSSGHRPGWLGDAGVGLSVSHRSIRSLAGMEGSHRRSVTVRFDQMTDDVLVNWVRMTQGLAFIEYRASGRKRTGARCGVRLPSGRYAST